MYVLLHKEIYVSYFLSLEKSFQIFCQHLLLLRSQFQTHCCSFKGKLVFWLFKRFYLVFSLQSFSYFVFICGFICFCPISGTSFKQILLFFFFYCISWIILEFLSVLVTIFFLHVSLCTFFELYSSNWLSLQQFLTSH